MNLKTVDFKPFRYKAKLLGNRVAQPEANAVNWVVRNAIIAVSLKYLSHFWRSLKMLLINWKAESTLDGCVLYVADTENASGNDSNSIVFNIKDTKLCVPVVTLSARDNLNYQNFVEKDLKDRFIVMNIKQKVIIEMQQMSLDIFSNQNFLG